MRTLLIALSIALVLTGIALAIKKHRTPAYAKTAPASEALPVPAPQAPQATQAPQAAPNAAAAPARAGCACCNRGQTATPGASRIGTAKKIALDYYSGKYGDKKVDVEVKDFGCHFEAYITKDSRLLKRLSINGNNVYEI